jgi:hypothetical protein
MATHHAVSGEIVDLKTWSNDLGAEKSKVIAKTKGLELARLVISPPCQPSPIQHLIGITSI